MNPNLKLAKNTAKCLRSRRCVKRVVRLFLTPSEAKRLSDILQAAIREAFDVDKILLCDQINQKIKTQLEREKQ